MTEENKIELGKEADLGSKIFYLPKIDEDGYYCGECACMNDPQTGEPMLPADVVQAEKPCDDPAKAEYFYLWKDGAWVTEAKPKTLQDFAACGAISHESQTARCEELRQTLYALAQESSDEYRVVRGEKNEWLVEAIPEKTEEEKYEEAAKEVRQKRDSLLSATDYLMASDYPITEEHLAEVKTYRQALRDVPEQEGFPYSVTWPEKPEWLK